MNTKSVTNEQKSVTYTHDRLQQEIFKHLYNNYPELRGCFWHTPNEFAPDTFIETQCNRICKGKLPSFLRTVFELYKKHFVFQLSQRKSIGVLAGVTDLVLYYRGVLLMMDIKLPGDCLSDAQKRFIAANELQGGKFIEINNLDQGKEDINKFFNISLQ